MLFQSLSPVARVSVEALARYLAPLQVESGLINVGNSPEITIEYRLAEISIKEDPRTKYFVVFVFDKHKRNRLLLLNEALLNEIIGDLETKQLTSDMSVLILIGKDGSTAKTQMSCVFNSFKLKKLVVLDFRKDNQMVDFMTKLLSDIDRVETRRSCLRDPARMDLTSLPPSDKKIKIKDETADERHIIIFANQLLQLPGLTEKMALALAGKYRRPINLMTALIQDPKTLKEFKYSNQKGELKSINVRVEAQIKKAFSYESNSNDLLR